MELHTIGIDLGKTVFHLVAQLARQGCCSQKFRASNCCTSRRTCSRIDWHGSLRRRPFSRGLCASKVMRYD